MPFILGEGINSVSSQFNSAILAQRRAIANGVYDVHTNTMQYPAITQPTHARFEVVPADSNAADHGKADSSSTVFPPLKPLVARNFLVFDTYMESQPGLRGPALPALQAIKPAPPAATAPLTYVPPFGGVSAPPLSAVPAAIRDLLPADCRAAFDEAAERERAWQARWHRPEAELGCRLREPVVDKAIMPGQVGLVADR